MLIDEFLPGYEFSQSHDIIVQAPVEQSYEAIRNLNLARSKLIRLLVRLRGFTPPIRSTLAGLLEETNFVLLGEQYAGEILFGLVGQFWTLSGHTQGLDVEQFRNFQEEGYAKAVWNFAVDPISDTSTEVSTETRIQCMDQISRRKFKLYWFLMHGFSGVIRRIALREIKRDAESRCL